MHRRSHAYQALRRYGWAKRSAPTNELSEAVSAPSFRPKTSSVKLLAPTAPKRQRSKTDKSFSLERHGTADDDQDDFGRDEDAPLRL